MDICGTCRPTCGVTACHPPPRKRTLPVYSVNGEEPRLVGERCAGFVLQHSYEGNRITDSANVAYIQVGERWYRLYFECATIFWRLSQPPEAAQNSGIASGLLLNDLSGMEGIVGHTFEEVAYEASASGDVEV